MAKSERSLLLNGRDHHSQIEGSLTRPHRGGVREVPVEWGISRCVRVEVCQTGPCHGQIREIVAAEWKTLSQRIEECPTEPFHGRIGEAVAEWKTLSWPNRTLLE